MHGMHEACLTMAFFGAGYLAFYSLGGIFVHCTRYEDNILSLEDSIDGGLNRSRGGDELSRLLRTLVEEKSER